jgi:hypothetical protein
MVWNAGEIYTLPQTDLRDILLQGCQKAHIQALFFCTHSRFSIQLLESHTPVQADTVLCCSTGARRHKPTNFIAPWTPSNLLLSAGNPSDTCKWIPCSTIQYSQVLGARRTASPGCPVAHTPHCSSLWESPCSFLKEPKSRNPIPFNEWQSATLRVPGGLPPLVHRGSALSTMLAYRRVPTPQWKSKNLSSSTEWQSDIQLAPGSLLLRVHRGPALPTAPTHIRVPAPQWKGWKHSSSNEW